MKIKNFYAAQNKLKQAGINIYDLINDKIKETTKEGHL